MKRIEGMLLVVLLALSSLTATAQISDAMRKLNTAVFAVKELYVDTVNEYLTLLNIVISADERKNGCFTRAR